MHPAPKALPLLAGLAALLCLAPAAGQEGPTAAHVERPGAAAWHRAGEKGRGVKVAVLDTDFFGYRDELGRTLPRAVKARSFRRDRDLGARRTAHGLRA